MSHGGRTWQCLLRGKLKKGIQQTRTVAVVGDQVRFSILAADEEPPTGVIEEVLPRRNRISRQSSKRSGGRTEQVLMANLDQVLAVQSLHEPTPQAGFIDRLLVAVERFGVQGILILNKWDLVGPGDDQARWEYYQEIGYRLLRTSVPQGLGITELHDLMQGKISLLIGASGVGKSSLLNAIQPGLRLRVAEVTGKTGLGKHTTTRTELFPLADGGYIADSPGIRGFDPWDIAPEQVQDYFPDFATGRSRCRFRTCIHRDEPNCGVKEDVSLGVVPQWRHQAYLDLLDGLKDRQGRTWQRG